MSSTVSFRGLDGALKLSAVVAALTALALVPLIIDKESSLLRLLYYVLMWFPFSVSGWNLITNYMIVPLNDQKDDDEHITFTGTLISFFLYMTSFALLLIPFWLNDPHHAFENMPDHLEVWEIWIKFAAAGIILSGEGGFMTLVPESWLCKLIVSLLGYSSYLFIVFGIVINVVLRIEAYKKMSHREKKLYNQYMGLPEIAFNLSNLVIYVIIYSIVTGIALVPLIIDPDATICRILYYFVFWIPYAMTIVSMIYVFREIVNQTKIHSPVSIIIVAVFMLLHAISWALIFMPFWIYDSTDTWVHLDGNLPAFEAWLHLVGTSILVSCGGEFMATIPSSWLAQLVAGILVVFSFPLLLFGFGAIGVTVWESVQRKHSRVEQSPKIESSVYSSKYQSIEPKGRLAH